MKNTVQVLHVEDEPSLTELAADFLEREHDRIEVLSETDSVTLSDDWKKPISTVS